MHVTMDGGGITLAGGGIRCHAGRTTIEDDHGVSDANDCGEISNKPSWNHELPVLTKTLPSNLYEDTEPTHISFRELASLWSERNHGNAALDQSDHGLSSSSQSNHSSGDTPPDDCFPNGQPCRFPSGGNQSDAADDDTPPVIPPRMKARNQQEADASIHRDFMESMKQLNDCGWYWGPLSKEEAEAKLANTPVGSFLVRDSSNERYILSLSVRHHERVYHARIKHHQGHFSVLSQPDSHGKSTIKDFVEQCVDNSRNGRFPYVTRPSGPGSPPLPVYLLHPVSHFIHMRSLRQMCRFRIVQLVRRDHIDCMPIPTHIKNYLKEAQHYVEYLDD